jgi:4-hydroxy-2-oxoheptanedioate aldolase
VSVQHHVLAAQAHGVPTLVRVGHDEPALVLRCLDLGVAGIVFPHVTSADDARRAVAAAHYPPLGARGFASYTRAGRYGATSPGQHLDAAADTLVVVMIEDAAGCQAAADILAVDGVDAVFVGPADLAVALGLRGDARHPDVLAASREVHETAAKADRAVVMIAGTLEAARDAFDAGAHLVLYNTAAVLTDTFRRLAATRRT